MHPSPSPETLFLKFPATMFATSPKASASSLPTLLGSTPSILDCHDHCGFAAAADAQHSAQLSRESDHRGHFQGGGCFRLIGLQFAAQHQLKDLTGSDLQERGPVVMVRDGIGSSFAAFMRV